MGNIKLANDTKVLAATDIREAVLLEQRFDKGVDTSTAQWIYNVPSGTNRLNLHCEDEDVFDVRVWQYLETWASGSISSSTLTSVKYHKSAINTNALIAFYDGAAYPGPSAEGDLRYEKQGYTNPLRASFGHVVTSSTDYMKINTIVSSNISMSAWLYYGFTTTRLAASLPLFPAYPAADEASSYPRGIYIDVVSNTDTPITIQLTEEAGRTAAADPV